MSYVVFDIETTGFMSTKDDIIQFAYALFDANNQFVKSEVLYFYYEGMSWSEEAYVVHNIPLSLLKEHADKFYENCIKMYTVLNMANVIGYNSNSFDCPFVNNWLLRRGLRKFEFMSTTDVMLSLRPLTKKSRIKLTKLSELCNITPDVIKNVMSLWFPDNTGKSAHDAAYDVTATALLALMGIRKGYISMYAKPEDKSETQYDYSSIEVIDKGLPVYDNGFVLNVAGTDIVFNPDSSKYKMLEPTQSMFKIPIPFRRVDDFKYEMEYNEVKFVFEEIGDKDIFTIINPYTSITSESYDMLPILRNIFKEG